MSVSNLTKQIALWLMLTVSVSGCALTREPTRTPRTAIEQLLLSHAITRSVKYLRLPLRTPAAVVVEMAGFPNDRTVLQPRFLGTATTAEPAVLPVLRGHASDLPVMQGKIEGKLGESGFTLSSPDSAPRYDLRVIVEALGTDQGESFIGMPPVQSVLLPFALPELTLFKAQRQRAYARYTVDIYDAKTGAFIKGTPWYEGAAYYNQYTVLFFFTFERSDLLSTP